jgi:hypothetical protein
MLTEQIKEELSRIDKTPFHNKMFHHVNGLLDASRGHMSKYYTRWDASNNAYRAYRNLDKDDLKAIKEGRPTKQKIPAVYAKVQSFKSFILGMYFQRPRFFELDSVGAEDEEYKELAEVLLQGDLEANQWYNKVGQWATHVGKMGVGVIKHSWQEQVDYFPKTILQPQFGFGPFSFGKKEVTQVEEMLVNAGNAINCVSPYNFFPDTRFGLHEFQQGEFCADEFDISMTELFKLQQKGDVAGINLLPTLSYERAGYRKRIGLDRRSMIDYNDTNKTRNLVRIAEVQIKITPSEFKLENDVPLGKESYPVMYLLWIANDSRIIKFQPMGYLHKKFTYSLAQYDEDDADVVNMSLSDLSQPLQDVSDWMLSSRIESVSRSIEDKLIVDPIGVEVETVRNRSRIILLKKGASRAGVDKYIKQLDVRDVTQNHPNDISMIGQIINSVTGVNENMQGNYHTGRRSATEARVVTQGGNARIKMIAQLAWGSCFAPLGSMLLTNLRQGLKPELILKYAGSQWAAPEKQGAIQMFLAPPELLIGARDVWVFDGTLSSEKNYMAQQLSELFQQVIQLGPTGLLTLDISPKLLLEKVYELLGVPNLSVFSMMKDPQTLQNVVQQLVQQQVQQALMQMQQQQPPVDPNANAQ